MTRVPKTPAKIRLILRELAEDMDAPADWHYADVVADFRERLNAVFAGLRAFFGANDVPDDFGFAERDYSATGKTVNQAAFERLRRAVRAANELADSLPTTPVSAAVTGQAVGGLHPDVERVSGKLMMDGHPAQAIFEAFKAVNNRVKRLSGSILDGKALMASAFAENGSSLRLNVGVTQSDRDEQEGFKFIFMGAMQGIRNPKAHEETIEIDPQRAAEYLALASLLMRRLDDVEVLRGAGSSG